MATEIVPDIDVALKSYDYIRLTWSDIHGIQRGVYIPRRNIKDTLKSGVQAYCGLNAFGTRTQAIFLPEADSENNDNMIVLPRYDTIHPVSWATDTNFSIGEILSTCHWKDGRPQESCSQHVLLTQLQRLDEMNLKLYSTFELEFTLYKNNEPVFPGTDMYSMLVLSESQKVLLQMDNLLAASGVDLEKIHPEYGPGQFEMVLKPQWGIKTGDNGFIVKEAVKEIAAINGYKAVFMSRPGKDISDNGLHFTLSLWDKKGNNVFSGTEGDLSETAQYFLAGLCEHGPALTAFFAPTVNCYRRFFNLISPKSICWGKGNRFSAYRTKGYGPSGACIENRLPSGSSNPYLVMAATLAAGIDGIQRKLKLQPEGNFKGTDGGTLPERLEDALEALDKDVILKESLGNMLIRWFIQCKRETELPNFPDFDKNAFSEEVMAKEFELFARLL